MCKEQTALKLGATQQPETTNRNAQHYKQAHTWPFAIYSTLLEKDRRKTTTEESPFLRLKKVAPLRE